MHLYTLPASSDVREEARRRGEARRGEGRGEEQDPAEPKRATKINKKISNRNRK
jgi:hypothetical protein